MEYLPLIICGIGCALRVIWRFGYGFEHVRLGHLWVMKKSDFQYCKPTKGPIRAQSKMKASRPPCGTISLPFFSRS